MSTAENPHAGQGMVVLDIGGDIGALVVTMPDGALGTELHLSAYRDPSLDVHTGVWRRDLGSRVIAAAVFLELVEGVYGILDEAGDEVRRVEIRGGELSEIDLTI
jgi:hypothetical protein